MFMESQPPMLMCFHAYKKQCYCHLEDFEGRILKTPILNNPYSIGSRSCVGLTCGYLVFYVEIFKAFWLVNPITRHHLHFHNSPKITFVELIKCILVYSPSKPGSGWVLVVINMHYNKIWFSVAGKRAWNHVSCDDYFLDLHAFKGKIYTLNSGGHLYELTLNPKPKLSMLEFKDFGVPDMYRQEFLSLGENLYVIGRSPRPRIIYEVDCGKMKWVSPEEKTMGEYAIFLNKWNHGVAFKPKPWAVDPRSKYEAYDCFRDRTTDETQKGRFFRTHMWYFPHLCLDVDPMH